MPKSKSGLVKTNHYLDPVVMRALKWIAQRRGSTVAALVREACRKYALEQLEREKSNTETLHDDRFA